MSLWQRLKRDKGHSRVPYDVLWLVVHLPFLGALLYFELQDAADDFPTIFTIYLGCYVAALVYIVQHRRTWGRWRRAYQGDTAMEFIEFSPQGICYGRRGIVRIAVRWDLCEISWHNNGQPEAISTMVEGVVPFMISDLTAWERTQLLYWLKSARGTYVDHCSSCQYDLRGSPGPTCPECGNPVRIAGVNEPPSYPPSGL